MSALPPPPPPPPTNGKSAGNKPPSPTRLKRSASQPSTPAKPKATRKAKQRAKQQSPAQQSAAPSGGGNAKLFLGMLAGILLCAAFGGGIWASKSGVFEQFLSTDRSESLVDSEKSVKTVAPGAALKPEAEDEGPAPAKEEDAPVMPPVDAPPVPKPVVPKLPVEDFTVVSSDLGAPFQVLSSPTTDSTLVYSDFRFRHLDVIEVRNSRTGQLLKELDHTGIAGIEFAITCGKLVSWSERRAIIWSSTFAAERIISLKDFVLKTCRISPDGKFILVIGIDESEFDRPLVARLYDIRSERVVYSKTLERNGRRFYQSSSKSRTLASFSGDSASLFVSHSSGVEVVQLTDLSVKITPLPPGHIMQASKNELAHYSVDETSGDGTLTVWDIVDGTKFGVPVSGRQPNLITPIYGVGLVGAIGESVFIWEKASGVSRPTKAHDSFITTIAADPVSRRFATGSRDWKVHVWDMSGTRLATCKKHKDSIHAMDFSRDGKQLWTTAGNEIVIWNVERMIRKTPK